MIGAGATAGAVDGVVGRAGGAVGIAEGEDEDDGGTTVAAVGVEAVVVVAVKEGVIGIAEADIECGSRC
jgi:hypothetical protein